MRLPDPGAQGLYLDLGWAIVIAAVLLAARARGADPLPVRRRRAIGATVAGASLALALLPAPWSPSFWLGMALQYPSVTTVVLSAAYVASFARADGPLPAIRLMPPWAAVTLVSVAALLYAGVFGWLPYDLYAFGYSRLSAAIIATVLVALWATFVLHGGWACMAVAAASAMHMTFALPTGNAWDALLDPMLVMWALAGSVRAALPQASRRIYSRGG